MTTILQFPVRNKGRVRKSQGPQSMGEHALEFVQLFADASQTGNVARLVEVRADQDPHDQGHLALMLAASLYALMTPEQKTSLISSFKYLATRDPRAVELLRILKAE